MSSGMLPMGFSYSQISEGGSKINKQGIDTNIQRLSSYYLIILLSSYYFFLLLRKSGGAKAPPAPPSARALRNKS